jgi:hypothetical protein
MRTTLSYQSATFDSNGKIIDTTLESHVRPNNAVPDGQLNNIGIQTRTGELYRFNSATGPATRSPSHQSVQLTARTGLVKIGGYEVTPEVAATLAEVAPSLTEDPSVQQAKEAKAADAARSEEITREDLNRHPDDQIEAAHQHFVGEVSQQNQIALMVYAHRGEAPPADLIKTIADEMHVPLYEAIDKVNAISMATQAQFTVLARSMNLDADKAADWIKSHRRDTAMAAAQAHGLRRDLLAWKPLLEDYRRATGDGVKR